MPCAAALVTLAEEALSPSAALNLILRVWGWSGFFCKLSRDYQEQIIARHMDTFA